MAISRSKKFFEIFFFDFRVQNSKLHDICSTSKIVHLPFKIDSLYDYTFNYNIHVDYHKLQHPAKSCNYFSMSRSSFCIFFS